MATQIILVGLEGHQSVMLRAVPRMADAKLTAVVHPRAEAVASFRRANPWAEGVHHFTDLETALANLKPDVLEFLEVTRLSRVLTICKDEAEALARVEAFRAGREEPFRLAT